MLLAVRQTREIRKGRTCSSIRTTSLFFPRKIRSMGNSMPMVWTPRDGTIQRPAPSRAHLLSFAQQADEPLPVSVGQDCLGGDKGLARLVIDVHQPLPALSSSVACRSSTV